jgi:hypothetical protein
MNVIVGRTQCKVRHTNSGIARSGLASDGVMDHRDQQSVAALHLFRSRLILCLSDIRVAV